MVRYTLTLLLVVATLLVEGEVPCTDEMAFMCGKYTTCCIANEIPVCCQSLNAICCFESETCCLKGYECTSDGMCAAKPWGRMAWRTLRTPRIIATRLRTEYHS